MDRRVETERLTTFLANSRLSGSALVLTGGPGQGKTAVLREARSMAAARGMRVLGLDLSAGEDVQASGLAPLWEELGSRPRLVHDPTDELIAGNELLRQLAVASAGIPLLVCIDDADRLDEVSVSILAFAGRRLATTRAGLLAASTTGSTSPLRRRGLPELDLPPMTDSDSMELLETRAPKLAPPVSRRVLADARGNPLALLELPSALTERQRLGLDPLPWVLPLTGRLRGVHEAALNRITAAAFELLVTLAVIRPRALDGLGSERSSDGTGILGLVEKSTQALRELEDRGFVTVQADSEPIQFAAPLIRNAVIDRATPDQVRAAHLRLAEALRDRPDRRTWYLAAAIAGVDDEMASELERLAQRASHAGDLEEAVDLLRRAAELSTTSVDRSARLSAAAQLHVSMAGDLPAAARLLANASLADTMSPENPGSAAARAQLLLLQGGHASEVRRILVASLDRTSTETDETSEEHAGIAAALQLLFYVCLLEARPEPWLTYGRLVRIHQERRGPVLGMVDRLLPDITRATSATLVSLDDGIARIAGVAPDPSEVILVGIAAFHLDRLADCRAPLVAVMEQARQGPSRFLGVQAMLRLSLDDCLTGQFARGSTLALEAMALSTSMGHHEQLWPFELSLALVAAMRGDRAGVDSLTDSMAAWAVPRGALLVEHHCAHVKSLAALGEEDFATAYECAASISPPGTLAGYTTVAVWACLDLVEAAVATGRHQQAQAHVDALLRSGVGELSPRLAQRVAAAVALTATDERAPELFAEALAVEHVERWPFETARVELAYGERLRRLHDPVRAQDHLRRAYETFRRLGANPWVSRAANQLRASGSPVPVPVGRRRSRPALSGRDLEIATLAASGLSNREIGELLFLSPRTIGSRLYRIFPKLGVASRAALRDALDELDAEPDSDEREA